MFNFSADFVGMQETRLTQAGQRCMQQLAKESVELFLGLPLRFPTGGISGAPQGGVGLLCRMGRVCRKVDASDDPVQQKLRHSGG